MDHTGSKPAAALCYNFQMYGLSGEEKNILTRPQGEIINWIINSFKRFTYNLIHKQVIYMQKMLQIKLLLLLIKVMMEILHLMNSFDFISFTSPLLKTYKIF